MDAAVRFPTSPQAVTAAHLKLSKCMSVEQAFQAIVRNCIDQIEGNEAGVARCHDPESLHQMRVGMRRLDAAFALFSDLLAPPAIADELVWLMDQLGPARDWDVFVGSILPSVIGALPGQPALERLRVAAREKSAVLGAQASAAVSSDRFGKLVSALEQWVEQRGWRDDLPAKGLARLKRRVSDVAAAVLEREQQRLLRRGRNLGEADARRRHRLRIAAKRTRYAAEFFASLFPRKRMGPWLRALTRLQDELGSHNAPSVAARLLEDAGDGQREGAALARGYLAARSQAGEGRVRSLWKKFQCHASRSPALPTSYRA